MLVASSLPCSQSKHETLCWRCEADVQENGWPFRNAPVHVDYLIDRNVGIIVVSECA